MSPVRSHELVDRRILREVRTEDSELVDLAILLREEVDRFEGGVLVYGIDVTKKWHSRRAGDRGGHTAVEERWGEVGGMRTT